MRMQDEIRAEYTASITKYCCIHGILMDGTDCKILLHKGASKTFMCKTFCLSYPLLHSLPMYVLRTKNILVGNDQYLGMNIELRYIDWSLRFMIMWKW